MRTILHSDLNAFYASVECLYRPELRAFPVAVCGDPESRHGIILTKNELAKGFGVRTGEAIWEARAKCPGLRLVAADMDKYVRFSRMMRAIYADYSDQVEPFGMDEAWLDVTGENGKRVADEIRRRAREELGITASVGVADNKIFAKLGSDMQKPDATTVITRENFRQKVWPLPAGDLLYVGPSTRKKLLRYQIQTIGDLAQCDVNVLTLLLGGAGETLYAFANGLDQTPVSRPGNEPPPKSIGNSTTTARDVACEEDALWVLMMLAETVGARMREAGVRGSEIQLWVRDNELLSFDRHAQLPQATDLDREICDAAMALLRAHYGWMRPIRSLGIRVGKLHFADEPEQVSLFENPRREKERAAEQAVDELRRRFGDGCVRRGYLFCDKALAAKPHKEYKPFECVRQG